MRFIRKGGRIIPLRNWQQGRPSELEHVVEVAKARKIAKAGMPNDMIHGAFWKYTRERAQNTGFKIAKRIARFRLKGML